MSTGRRLGTVLALAALLAAPARALAVPTVNGEFSVSEMPSHLALGPDGNIWVTLGGGGNKLARVTPAGAVTEYAAPTLSGSPVGIVAGPDGAMWVTDSGHVARFTTANPDGAVETAVASITDARGIVVGPDGNLWTASVDQLVKIPPAAPATFTPFTIAGMGAREIASGTDGRLWIDDFARAGVVSATTAGASVFHSTGGGPQGIAAGPGGQVLYTNPSAPHTIGRLTLGATPLSTDTPNSDPSGAVFGPDGAYWIANFSATTLGRLTTTGTYTTLSGLSPGSGPRFIAVGNENTLWVSLEQGKKIARVADVETPTGGGGGGTGGGGGGTGGTGGGTGGGGGGSKGADTTAPVVTRLSIGSAFRVGSEPTALAGTAAKTGTAIRFTLSEDALARMLIQRVTAGLKKGTSCVRPTRALREAKAKKCKRYVGIGTLTRASKKGANRFAFTGRLADRGLSPGRYRLEVTAVDSARNKSEPVRKGFRILAPAKKH